MALELRASMTEGGGGVVLAAMREQWASMTGMACMFVSTILIGLSIQPIYNVPEARAFGEEGASTASFVLFELIMIGVFTVAIIWLARRNFDLMITLIVYFALSMSLFYAIQPYIALPFWLVGWEWMLGLNVALISVALSLGLMILLYRFPEWYVVNGVGVLVGAGVVTLIGVSFVPVLIIGFMVAAAIYDHWAVNGSKHMLELADTMIGLKLPVLLVAPKSANYSFIDEEDSVMGEDRGKTRDQIDWDDPVPHLENVKVKKEGRDALFMGLGDVIFPGMLVISSVSFLPQTGGEVTYFSAFGVMYADPLIVALGTLFGGLLGYFALMTQVAMGKPQAGLPLLNGGSILGYLVSGYFALGIGNLWQDITFF